MPRVRAFYDGLTPFYHLIFEDWDASMRRQGAELDAIIRAEWGPSVHAVLDAAAGIGTQALPLARLGYDVTGSDLSVMALERCRREAAARGLRIKNAVADLRNLPAGSERFDLVIVCDNALPHLLTDEELRTALAECLRCVVPGGGCLISVRDYPDVPPTGSEIRLHGVRSVGDARMVLYQVWAWDGPHYDMALYLTEDRGGAECQIQVFRTRYYAVPVRRLLALMSEAGFQKVRRIDDAYFQPVLIGTRPRAG